MAASMKVLISAYVAVIGALFGISVALPLSQKHKGILQKVTFTIFIESVLLINSRFLWKQVTSVIDHIFAHLTVCKHLSKSCLILFLGAAQFSFLTNLFFITEEPHWFAHLCYICLGTFAQLGIWLFFVNSVAWLIKQLNIIPKLSKKSKVVKVSLACLYALSVSMYGVYRGAQLPSVRTVKIPIKGLDRDFEGFRIVQINDIHLGPTVGKTRLQGIIDIVNTLQPDAVVIVGDLTDGKVADLKTAAQPLAQIHATHGVFYVTGNHEYMTNDVDNWFRFLGEDLGIHVLHNSHRKISSPNDDSQFFCMAGTDDIVADRFRYSGHTFDVGSAVAGCGGHKPVVLLAHQPTAAKRALDSQHSKNIHLVLAGHTHGGQMFPVSLGAWLVNPFFVGLYEYRGSHVYVSEGTVFWGIPMRIFTSMEITEILLTVA